MSDDYSSSGGLKGLINELKNYSGITRKNPIGKFAAMIKRLEGKNIISSFGEDCAVVDLDNEYILLAADGIMESLTRKDPFWAGYCSVLANVNDVLAMGGRPLALVDVLSYRDEEVLREITKGINLALERFSVPLVGGHLHPESSYDSIEVAILGAVGKNSIIRSDLARSGDSILAAYDLNGSPREGFPCHWDTTLKRSNEVVRKRMRSIWELAEKGLVSSGKDISNPGLIGTLGMLLESSGKGGVVDLESLRTPQNLSLQHWLKVYHGFGFVFSCAEGDTPRVGEIFKKVGIEVDEIGRIDDSSTLDLCLKGERKRMFNFKKGGVTGLFSELKS